MGEQIKATEIQIAHRKRFLLLRRQNVLVQSAAFVDAYDLASKSERVTFGCMLFDVNPTKLRKWIRDILYDDFQNHTTIELRTIASTYGVKNYSRMDKDTLIHTLIQEGIEDGSKRRAGVDSNTVGQNETAATISRLPKTSS